MRYTVCGFASLGGPDDSKRLIVRKKSRKDSRQDALCGAYRSTSRWIIALEISADVGQTPPFAPHERAKRLLSTH